MPAVASVEDMIATVKAIAQLARKICDESGPDLYYQGGADALERLVEVLEQES